MSEGCPYDTICFHAHQCAEKYLKALLTLRSIDFPKTHDLTELITLVPNDIKLEVTMPELEELNPYAIETRYPGTWEPQTRDHAVRAVEIAQHVCQAVRTHLPSSLFGLNEG